MLIDLSKLPVREIYGWLTSAIAPRPIAWVSTVSPEGRTNLAPFSFFQGITSNPPLLMFVPVDNRDGQPKDTLRNLRQVPEFVVNAVSYALAERMTATAATLPYGESEFEKFGIAAAPSAGIRPPRVAESPLSFECTVHQILDIGQGAAAAHVVLGRIHHIHVSDSVLGPDGKIDPAKIDLVGKLGGELYCRTTERFTLARPK